MLQPLATIALMIVALLLSKGRAADQELQLSILKEDDADGAGGGNATQLILRFLRGDDDAQLLAKAVAFVAEHELGGGEVAGCTRGDAECAAGALAGAMRARCARADAEDDDDDDDDDDGGGRRRRRRRKEAEEDGTKKQKKKQKQKSSATSSSSSSSSSSSAARAASWDVASASMRRSLTVVDGFLARPDALREFALSQPFDHKGQHPGRRTRSFAGDATFAPISRAVEEETVVGVPPRQLLLPRG